MNGDASVALDPRDVPFLPATAVGSPEAHGFTGTETDAA
jgi:hypothetical protein